MSRFRLRMKHCDKPRNHLGPITPRRDTVQLPGNMDNSRACLRACVSESNRVGREWFRLLLEWWNVGKYVYMHVCAPCGSMSVCLWRRICDGSSYPWNDILVGECACVCVWEWIVCVCVCVRMMDQPISTEAGWQSGAEDTENGRMFWCCDQISDVFWLLKIGELRFKHFRGLFLLSGRLDAQRLLRLYVILESTQLIVTIQILSSVVSN